MQLRIGLQHCKPIRSCTNRLSWSETFSWLVELDAACRVHVLQHPDSDGELLIIFAAARECVCSIAYAFNTVRIRFYYCKPVLKCTNKFAMCAASFLSLGDALQRRIPARWGGGHVAPSWIRIRKAKNTFAVLLSCS